MTQKAGDLYRLIKPYIAKDFSGRGGASTIVAAGTSSSGDHTHDAYFTVSEGDARYLLATTYGAHVGNSDAHHDQMHALIGGDHTVIGAENQIVGLNGANTLALLTPSSDGSGGGTILITDGSGDIEIHDLAANQVDATTGNITTVNATTVGATTGNITTVNSTIGNITTVNATTVVADTGWIDTVHTDLLYAIDAQITDLTATEADITTLTGDDASIARIVGTEYVGTPVLTAPVGDLLLTTEDAANVLFDRPLVADVDIDGAPSIHLAPDTGTGDFEIIQAGQAYFDTVIAAAKRAEAGAVIVTKSLAELAIDFTVPAASSTTTMVVNELEGLPGWSPLESGSIAKVHFFEPDGTVQYPPEFKGGKADDGVGTVGGSSVLVDLPFSTLPLGTVDNALMSWTGSGYSTTVTTNQAVGLDISGNRCISYTGSATDAHLHYAGASRAAIEAEPDGYTMTGRFRRGYPSGGIGITLANRYLADTADEYVCIRCHADYNMRVSDRGQSVSPAGTTDSGYKPSAKTWHRYKIEYDYSANPTTLKAKFWVDGTSEPASWQIDCTYTGTGRPTSGTFGTWFYYNVNGVQYDDFRLESLSGTSSSNASVEIQTPTLAKNDDLLLAYITYADGVTVTAPSGWTTRATVGDGTATTRLYSRTLTSGDPSAWTWSSNNSAEMLGVIWAFNGVLSATYATVLADNDDEMSPASTAMTANQLRFLVTARWDSNDVSAVSAAAGYTQTNPATGTSYATVGQFRQFITATTDSPIITAELGDYGLFAVTMTPLAGQATPFAIGYAYGTIDEQDPQPGGLDDGQVAYDFMALAGQNSNVYGKLARAGSMVLEYGGAGDSFIDITTLDKAGAPYIRLMRVVGWNEGGYLGSEMVAHFGELKGLGAGYNSSGELGLVVGGSTSSRQAEFTTEKMRLAGADVTYEENGTTYLTITTDSGITLLANTVDERRYNRGYTFVDAAGTDLGGLDMSSTTSVTRQTLAVEEFDGNEVYLDIKAGADGNGAEIDISAVADDGVTSITLNTNSNGTDRTIAMDADVLDLSNVDAINDWSTLTLQSGWTHYVDTYGTDARAHAQYKRVGDLVYLRGAVIKSTSTTAGDIMLQMPVGARPAYYHDYISCAANDTVVGIRISDGGNVIVRTGGIASPTRIALDGIFFSTQAE